MSRKRNANETERRRPNANETAAIDEARAAHDSRPVRAQMERRPAANANTLDLGATHSDEKGAALLLYDTFASSSDDYVNASMVHLAQITSRNSEISMPDLNSALALIGAIGPQNELESAVAAQMAATHDLSMMMLRRAKGADSLDRIKEYGNLATKLQRTFTTQMKALADWRRGGEQVVRHIHVYEGGQAVVAETVMVGGQNEKGSINAHTTAAIGGRSALLGSCSDNGQAVPVSCDAERPVPNARRSQPRRWSAERKP